MFWQRRCSISLGAREKFRILRTVCHHATRGSSNTCMSSSNNLIITSKEFCVLQMHVSVWSLKCHSVFQFEDWYVRLCVNPLHGELNEERLLSMVPTTVVHFTFSPIKSCRILTVSSALWPAARLLSTQSKNAQVCLHTYLRQVFSEPQRRFCLHDRWRNLVEMVLNERLLVTDL